MSTDLVTVETSPLQILQLAVEQGSNADALEKIAGLIERRERWDAERAFNEAMCACQAELPAVVKKAENKQTKSWYAKLETIGEAIDPIIHGHGFSQSFGTDDSPTPGFIRIVCDLRHSGGHCQRYKLDLPPDDKGMQGSVNKTMVHGIGSTLSYGERYLTCMMFKVRLADRDNDGNRSRELVTPDQIGDINDLIDRAAEALAKPSRDVLSTILKAYQIESLDALPAVHLTDAKARLHRLIKT